MLLEYIQTALEQAHYEMIEDEEPFYAETPGLAGVETPVLVFLAENVLT